MVVEADHASGKGQTAVSTPPKSAVSSAGSKKSLFVRKAGFVIPKNKLSGSLVPLFRGSKKSDAKLLNDEAFNVVQRKTKWGPDLTLDSSVRKGRALAYQARINQISEQLALGILESEDNEEPFSAAESQHGKRSDLHLSHEESELLVLERREIIGELMKLNPAYKAPADYKPLMKEAKVLIPFKEHPGYNFIGSIFGPASDRLKRLEKETGAKIKVCGIKADTGVKVEVTSADGKETRDNFEELYVHVSADSFDKIDSAVALVELLVIPVSVNTISSTKSVSTTSDDNRKPLSSPVPSIATPPPATPSTGPLAPPQNQLPSYPQAWPPAGPNQGAPHSQSGILVSNTNSTLPLRGSAFPKMSPVPSNPSNMPSISPNFVSVPSSVVHPRPSQLPPGFQSSYIQQEPQVRNSQFSLRLPPPISSTLPQALGTSSIISPVPMVHPPVVSPAETTVASVLSPMVGSNPGNSFPQPQGGFLPLRPLVPSEPAPSTPQTSQIVPPVQMLARAPPLNAATPGPATMVPFKAVTPMPLPPSSNDFTFQPHRPLAIPGPQLWQGRQPLNVARLPLPQQSQFVRRPMPHDLGNPLLPRPQMSNQADQPRLHMPSFFPGRPTVSQLPPRHPTLPGMQQHRPFIPPNIVNNGPFPPSPRSRMLYHYPGPAPVQRFPPPHTLQQPVIRPGRPFPGMMGTHQVYDPFSPTSASLNPQIGNRPPMIQNEGDPEYEDLMASVGVK